MSLSPSWGLSSPPGIPSATLPSYLMPRRRYVVRCRVQMPCTCCYGYARYIVKAVDEVAAEGFVLMNFPNSTPIRTRLLK